MTKRRVGPIILLVLPAQTIRFGGSSDSGVHAFDQTGDILIAVASAETRNVSISLKRDGCAAIQCQHGAPCVQAECLCNQVRIREPESTRTYGWSGALCEIPDCPGAPDCGGAARGECIVNGTYPSCKCAYPFTGSACQNYDLPESALVVGRTSASGSVQTTTFLSTEAGMPNRTRLHMSGTLTGSVEVGQTAVPLVLDRELLYVRAASRCSPSTRFLSVSHIISRVDRTTKALRLRMRRARPCTCA